MRQKTHSLSPPVTYYGHSSKLYERMLDLLPSWQWNKLHNEVEKTYRHVWDVQGPITKNEVKFNFDQKHLVPRFCTYCGSEISLPAGCHACWSDEE